jgi:hypothetical protein
MEQGVEFALRQAKGKKRKTITRFGENETRAEKASA